MPKYTLIISSKNKNSITQFLDFFFTNYKQNSQIFTKLFIKKNLKEKISVLKSPHVNKTAQEQFKYTHYHINITFQTPEIKKELFILKKIKNQIFPDLKMTIKSYYSKKSFLLLKQKPFYNQKLLVLKKNAYLLNKTISTLKILDYNGKHKTKSSDSSVGRAKD